MTPLQIETLIKVYAQPHEELNALGLAELKEMRLVERDPIAHPKLLLDRERHGFIVSIRGKAMMNALISLPKPIPKTVWVTEFVQVVDELKL